MIQLFIVVVNRPGQAPEDTHVVLLEAELAKDQLRDEVTVTSQMLFDSGEPLTVGELDEYHDLVKNWNNESPLSLRLGPLVHSIIPINLP